MASSDRTRREFLKAGSAAVAGAAAAGAQDPKGADTSKILNYNPKMGYRRLGKTGAMVSEVSLGGHGSLGLENRVQVLARAAELGVNYLDTNIVGECAQYGEALNGRRKDWYIGFASWPEKLTPDGEKQLSKESLVREIEGRLKHYKTDTLDLWRPVGATWGAGQNKIATLLDVNDWVLDMVVEVFQKVNKEGKVRWLGISAHNPKLFRKLLEKYPTFSAVVFPYLFTTKDLGGDSLLELAKQKDVGVIGLKPFGAGTTFGIRPNEIKGKLDPNAHVLVKKMLQEPRLTAIIPGVNTIEQLEENVKGSYERDKPLTRGDEQLLRRYAAAMHAHLPPSYHWLRQWETV
ncbi:MAG: aldo/keto reductase [Planctomycetes bacterium]|nr:aldo/keto reductase [Planctomycetota bacterium]